MKLLVKTLFEHLKNEYICLLMKNLYGDIFL
jgi:hypothetical protein